MTTGERIRIGIVGAGYIAAVHSAAYRSATGLFPEAPREVRLAAVADSDAGRADALRRSWGWERAENDWRAVTRAPDVDVVDISVPNVFHADVAMDALQHGKHVICEKPLADNGEAAAAMARAAREAECLAQVCFYYRVWPAIAWARELLDAGRVGRVQHLRARMLQDYAADPAHDMGWRVRRSQAGAGALGDLGSHVIDVARYLCGDVTAVCALARSLVDRPTAQGIDDLVSMLVEFETGASGVLEAGWAVQGHKCDLGFDLVAERGAIRFSWERSNEIQILEGDPRDPHNGFRTVLIGQGQPEADRFAGVPGQGLGYRDAFTLGIGRFLSALNRGESAVSPTFEDGLRVAEVVDSALASAERRQWVEVVPTAIL